MKIKAMLITLALTLAVIVSCVCVSADGAKSPSASQTVLLYSPKLQLMSPTLTATALSQSTTHLLPLTLRITPTVPTVMLPQTEIMALR